MIRKAIHGSYSEGFFIQSHPALIGDPIVAKGVWFGKARKSTHPLPSKTFANIPPRQFCQDAFHVGRESLAKGKRTTLHGQRI